MTDPTDPERRNGWTEESLALYLDQRALAQAELIDPQSPARRVKPREANRAWSPLRRER